MSGNIIILPGDFESIATYTVGSGGQATIEFTSIPQTFTHLQLRCSSKTSGASADSYIRLGYSGTNYATSYRHLLYGDGSSASGIAASGEGYIISTAGSGGTSIFSADIIDILDYTNTNKTKVFNTIGGMENNGGTNPYFRYGSGMWNSTAAITSITLYPQPTGSLAQYSSFALYGIKGAA